MKKTIILLLTLLTTTILVACGTSSNNTKLSGVYSYTGKTFSDENHDGQLKLYYELDVNETKSIYRIVAQAVTVPDLAGNAVNGDTVTLTK